MIITIMFQKWQENCDTMSIQTTFRTTATCYEIQQLVTLCDTTIFFVCSAMTLPQTIQFQSVLVCAWRSYNRQSQPALVHETEMITVKVFGVHMICQLCVLKLELLFKCWKKSARSTDCPWSRQADPATECWQRWDIRHENTEVKTLAALANEPGHWVTGSMGHLGHLFSLGHRVSGSYLWPGRRPEYFQLFQFSNKCSKCTAYILNANVIKVIDRCL